MGQTREWRKIPGVTQAGILSRHASWQAGSGYLQALASCEGASRRRSRKEHQTIKQRKNLLCRKSKPPAESKITKWFRQKNGSPLARNFYSKKRSSRSCATN